MTTDYHDYTTIDTPTEERRRLNIGDWYINAALCLKCGDTPRSKNRHDSATCRCGAVTVDGGSWYLRRDTDGDGHMDRSVKFNHITDD
jgi:hypothetical protein